MIGDSSIRPGGYEPISLPVALSKDVINTKEEGDSSEFHGTGSWIGRTPILATPVIYSVPASLVPRNVKY
jgi:hypothetical protein